MRRRRATIAISIALAALLLPAGSAVAKKQWTTTPKTISDPEEPIDFPTVASNSKGAAVAVWYGVDPDTAETRTMRAAIHRQGHKFDPPLTLGPASAPPGGGPPTLPKIAVDRFGDALATWVIKDPDGNSRAVASYLPRGGLFGDPQRLSDPGQPAFDPKPAFDRDGNAYVAWSRFDGATTRVQVASKLANSDSFGDPVTISPPGETADFPQLGVSDAGLAVVAWLSREKTPPFNHFVDAAIKPEGAGFQPAQTLSNKGSVDADDPELAVAPNGDALAAWRQEPNGPEDAQLGVASAAAGGQFGPPGVVPSVADFEPFNVRVGADDSGRFTLLWIDAPPESVKGTRFMRAAVTSAGSEDFSGEALATSTTDDFGDPSLSVARRGNAVAGWLDLPPLEAPPALDVARKGRKQDGFGAETFQMLSPAGVPVGEESVAASRRTAFAVWDVKGTGRGIGVMLNRLRRVH